MARVMNITTDSIKEGILKTTTGITIGNCKIKLLSQTFLRINFFQGDKVDKVFKDNVSSKYNSSKEYQFIFETKNIKSNFLEEWLIVGCVNKYWFFKGDNMLTVYLDITKLMCIKNSSMKLVESTYPLKRKLTLRFKV